ncbi:MAG: sigma-54-dependent Fis family transcriptional regulator [Gammaproteobacteria bacterium]|nr:sigma-54-dependent Fis family transcriptional regulator [Gammaproteobacteria bacterium]
MDQTLVLIVDDEPDICELLEITLARMGLDTLSAQNVTAAKQLFSEHHFNLCLTDMRLPDGDGLDLLDWIQAHYTNTPTVVITAHGNMEAAIRALKSGAFDFVSKPLDLNNLRSLVSAALKLKTDSILKSPGSQKLQLLGESPIMLDLKTTIGKLARSQAPVHIHGASGTGKELVARLIHEQGARRDQPFVPVNCSAIPAELMESEFFGHLKGTFTGAHADKKGLFAAANGGTLFLDEVADLPIAMQVKLLRAIQERAIRPVGAPAEIPVDVRVLSATHKNLEQLIAEGHFRQDLYYRINVIQIDVPGLHERTEDIPVLAQHILAGIALKQGAQIKSLAPDALSALLKYPFPGNVRELENILERAATLSENNTISIADLQLSAAKPHSEQEPISKTTTPATETTGALDDMLHDQERESIVQALEQTRWNKTKAAELLGISFRQLRYRIKKLNIE